MAVGSWRSNQEAGKTVAREGKIASVNEKDSPVPEKVKEAGAGSVRGERERERGPGYSLLMDTSCV